MSPSSLLAANLLQDPMTLFLSGLTLLILFIWYFATEIENRKRNIGTLLTIGIVGLSCLACWPPDKAFKGGIDLVGGSSFTLQVDPKVDDETGEPLPLGPDDVKQAIRTIEKRVNEYGNIDMLIAQQGEDKILIQMPGMSPEESGRIQELLEKVAKLELREVNLEGFRPGVDGRTLAERVHTGDEIVPGYRAYKQVAKDEDGKERTDYILLSKRVALTGKDVQQAWPLPPMGGGHKVAITLSSAGEDKMINLTKDMTEDRDRIAIVLDGEVLTAPVVQSTPLGKKFEISGQESAEEARSLANALLNPLENPLKIIHRSAISPTLGKATVEQGAYAGIAGLIITAIFVLIYYRLAGFIALIGLAINGVILFGAMAIFGFTFTLAGIAGMILTIGMAVDANVLIYERLREEIAAGKSLQHAISVSYEKAFSAIFDANITSLITAVVLFWLASGSVQGFAVTLTIGIIASMFSAILVTRVLFKWTSDLKILRKLSFLDLIGQPNVDFLSKGKVAALISGGLLLASIAGVGFRGKSSLGVDFTGGTIVTFQFTTESVPQKEVEDLLRGLGTSKEATVQEERTVTGELLTIRCASEDVDRIITHLRENIPALAELDPKTDVEGKSTDGSSFKVSANVEELSAVMGTEFLVTSLIALAIGLFGILVYVTVRFEFSFALGGFVAILHDVLISAGLIVLVGRELSLIHVSAILTIAGYSINDTIVIFDRIRDSLKSGTGEVKDLMNEAINATLSRTILTSATTIVTVALLTVFGSGQLRDFAMMILVGLVVGTYSSIFVASPIVLWWSQRKGGNLRTEVLQTTLQEADIRPANG